MLISGSSGASGPFQKEVIEAINNYRFSEGLHFLREDQEVIFMQLALNFLDFTVLGDKVSSILGRLSY